MLVAAGSRQLHLLDIFYSIVGPARVGVSGQHPLSAAE